jgi:hypothetical protein
MCETLDDDYNVVINEDKFFNLFTYNEYIKEIYNLENEYNEVE